MAKVSHQLRRIAIAIVALWFLLALAAPMDVLADAPESSTFESIDRFVEDRMDASRVPGVALSIVDSERVIHQRGFGQVGGSESAVSPQTPFYIGSTTKSITALATMQLVEAGRIDLDSPVQRYIPWFTLADADGAVRITVRHLLTMTSGIPSSAGGESFRSTLAQPSEEAVRALSDVTLAHEPGTTFAYVNANYVMLGVIVETVSGQSYGDYVREHIFQPLEMHDTYTDPLPVPGGAPTGHRYWFGVPVEHQMPRLPSLTSTGYVISTADDLSRYLMMYLNDGVYQGRTIISPEGLAELHRQAVAAPLGPWADGATSHYAMGWYVGGPWGEDSIVFHPGSAPNFSAMLLLDRERDLGVVTLINASTEMPLPGAAGEMRRIPAGVMSLLLGEEPSVSIGLARFYLFFDLTVLVVIAVQMLALVRLARRAGASSSARRVGRFLVPLVWELGLPVAILALPGLMAMSWASLWLWTPDVAVFVIIVGILSLAAGTLRLVTLGLAMRRGPGIALEPVPMKEALHGPAD